MLTHTPDLSVRLCIRYHYRKHAKKAAAERQKTHLSDTGNSFWSFIYVAETNSKKLLALLSALSVSLRDVRAPAQGCHPLGLIGNYLMDLGRVRWVKREVCCKHLEEPVRGFF